MRLKQNEAPWGPGTEYATYEKYWEHEVLEPLAEAYYKLTGEDITKEFGINSLETIRQNRTHYIFYKLEKEHGES